MPRITTGTPGTLGRAAGQAAATLYAERARADQLNREAQELALAERRLDQTDRTLDMRDRSFDRGVFESDRAFDLSAGQAAAENARADKRMKIAQKNAERAGAIFEQDMAERDATGSYFMNVIRNDPDRTPEELALLEQASPDVIRQVANVSELKNQLRQGRQKLGSFAGTVAQTMGLQEGDPRLAVMQQMVEGASDSLEAQQQVRAFLGEQLTDFMTAQAEIEQRAALAESFKPYAENLMQTLPPSSAGLVGAAYQMFANGHLEEDEFFGQLQSAVKNARSGTTNRTVGEELLTSAARSFGTQFGQGNMLDDEVREGIKTARDIAGSLDATKPTAAAPASASENANTDSRPVSQRINSYSGLVSDARKRIADEPTENARVQKAVEFVQKVFQKQGITGDDAAILAREMMNDILTKDES
ncbi:MAG: hypothetical protein ACX94C_07740 [Phycisphaerales bacterium]